MENKFNKFIKNPAIYGSIYGCLAGAFTGYMMCWRSKPFEELGNMVCRGACIGSVIGSAYSCVNSLNHLER